MLGNTPEKSGTSYTQLRFAPLPSLTLSKPPANMYPTPPLANPLSVVVLQTLLYWLVHKSTSIP